MSPSFYFLKNFLKNTKKIQFFKIMREHSVMAEVDGDDEDLEAARILQSILRHTQREMETNDDCID